MALERSSRRAVPKKPVESRPGEEAERVWTRRAASREKTARSSQVGMSIKKVSLMRTRWEVAVGRLRKVESCAEESQKPSAVSGDHGQS